MPNPKYIIDMEVDVKSPWKTIFEGKKKKRKKKIINGINKNWYMKYLRPWEWHFWWHLISEPLNGSCPIDHHLNSYFRSSFAFFMFFFVAMTCVVPVKLVVNIQTFIWHGEPQPQACLMQWTPKMWKKNSNRNISTEGTMQQKIMGQFTTLLK